MNDTLKRRRQFIFQMLKMPRKIRASELSDLKKPWNIDYGCVPTRFGDAQLGTLNGGVCFLYFAPSAQMGSSIKKLMKRWPNANFQENEASMKVLADKIFEDEHSEIDVILSGTEFQNSVWQTLLKIPSGKTWTYSECAEKMGKPAAVRAVANAVANNEVAFLIPCHRVVSKDGNKFKYAWGPECKKKLLSYEGNI